MAALHHLGVAGHHRHAGRGRGGGDRVDLGPEVLGGQALLQHERQGERHGRAPATARSLTVPLTARSPIEPPGKRSGVTTKLSVVIASSTPPTDSSAASPRAAGSGAPRAGTSIPSISVWLARPPAPWAMVMRGSRNLARLARAVSMRSRTTCSRSETAVRSAMPQTTSRSRAKRP